MTKAGDVGTPVGEANGTILGKIIEQMKESPNG